MPAHKFCPVVISVPSAPCGRAGCQRTGRSHQHQNVHDGVRFKQTVTGGTTHGSRLGFVTSWVTWLWPPQKNPAETRHMRSFQVQCSQKTDKAFKALNLQPPRSKGSLPRSKGSKSLIKSKVITCSRSEAAVNQIRLWFWQITVKEGCSSSSAAAEEDVHLRTSHRPTCVWMRSYLSYWCLWLTKKQLGLTDGKLRP